VVRTGNLLASPGFSNLGRTGAASLGRWVGCTASVAPTTGTWLVGDWVVTLTGRMFVCTVAGTPGTWVETGKTPANMVTLDTVQTIVENKTFSGSITMSDPAKTLAVAGIVDAATDVRVNGASVYTADNPPPGSLPTVPATKTAAYTALVGEVIRADASAGGFTITLPAAPGAGAAVTVMKVDATTNIVTVVGSGVTTIDGDPSCLIVSQWTSGVFIFDGTNWLIESTARATAEAASATSAQTGFRNVIRNGDAGITQRGTGPFTTTSGYTADGWWQSGAGGTVTANIVTLPLTTVMGAKNGVETVVTGQSAAGDLAAQSLRIENVRTFAGQQVTLSFEAFSASGTPKIGVEVMQYFGIGGSPSATVFTAINAVTISATRTRYYVTFMVPSIAGKTIGTVGSDYLAISFWLSAGSTWAARTSNIGIQNSTITITDVQLEAGSVASLFERLPQQMQLAWCQRYFQRVVPNIAAMAVGTTFAQGPGSFPVAMRAGPATTVQQATIANWRVESTTGSRIAPTNIAASANTQVYQITATIAAITAGQATIIQSTDSATAYIDFSAEL
jgi:hypothetical protein